MCLPNTSGYHKFKIMVPFMVILPSKLVYLLAGSLLILYGIILSWSMKVSIPFQDLRKVIYSKLWDCSNLVYGYNTQVIETNRTHTHKKSQKVTVGPLLLPLGNRITLHIDLKKMFSSFLKLICTKLGASSLIME